ncbi:hypothetical protein [Nocardiopsis tropica]|uniref:Uncharacterized protein n=1 Tax=Nocardiopsis tropica TaxID=109330 RepID=A0ABV2A139_9ACTN
MSILNGGGSGVLTSELGAMAAQTGQECRPAPTAGGMLTGRAERADQQLTSR